MNLKDIFNLLITQVESGKIYNADPKIISLFDSINFKPRIIEHHYGEDKVYYLDDLKNLIKEKI